MKIGIVGGNLLGCAAALNLALVVEHDVRLRLRDSSEPLSITIFEKEDSFGGNKFRSIGVSETDDGSSARHFTDDPSVTQVEVGSSRLINLMNGTFMQELVDYANGTYKALVVYGRAFRIPGEESLYRGKVGAAKPLFLWRYPSSGSAVKSFAVWDNEKQIYKLRHCGSAAMDSLSRFVSGSGIRVALFALVIHFAIESLAVSDMYNRMTSFALPMLLLVLVIMGPSNAVKRFNRNLAFWYSTFSLVRTYGMTVPIWRGSCVGFLKHLEVINNRSLCTCCLSVEQLLNNMQLDKYVLASAGDFFRKFRFDPEFATRFLDPMLAREYCDSSQERLNALASHLALLDSDFGNHEATDALAKIEPCNASLCSALLDAARANAQVEELLSTTVVAIEVIDQSGRIRVTSKDDTGERPAEDFDGVILCVQSASKDRPIRISLSTGVDVDSLMRTQSFETLQRSSGDVSGPGTHIAVVRGRLNPRFFGFTRAQDVPEHIEIHKNDHVSRLEKVSPSIGGSTGMDIVYSLLCSSDFRESLTFAALFEPGAAVLHFERRPADDRLLRPVPVDTSIDDIMPYYVIAKRFIYAAATDHIARHPELDAISARNAASLFSGVVDWNDQTEDADDSEEELVN